MLNKIQCQFPSSDKLRSSTFLTNCHGSRLQLCLYLGKQCLFLYKFKNQPRKLLMGFHNWNSANLLLLKSPIKNFNKDYQLTQQKRNPSGQRNNAKRIMFPINAFGIELITRLTYITPKHI